MIGSPGLPRNKVLRRYVVEKYAGMCMSDAAALVNSTNHGKACSYQRFVYAVRKHGLRHLFPAAGGEASWLAQRGYARG